MRGGSQLAGVMWMVAVSASPAFAGHSKTDVMEMLNGDRVTCEVRGLERGRLSIKTDAMGNFDVEWYKVARLTSAAFYEVEIGSGERYLGAVSSPAPRRLRVAGPGGDVTLDMTDVVGLVPIETGFWKRIDGSIDFGLTYTQSDGRTQYTLNTHAVRRTPNWVTQAQLSSQMTVESGVDQQRRNTFTATVQRALARRWFATVLTQVNENEELGLNLRAVGGGGIGRYLAQSNRTEVAFVAGASYAREQYVDQPGENRAEGVLGGECSVFTFGDRETTITASVLTYYALSGPGRFRTELSSAARRKFLKDFYWSINLVESFDSRPPSDQRRNDASVTVSLGWSF